MSTPIVRMQMTDAATGESVTHEFLLCVTEERVRKFLAYYESHQCRAESMLSHLEKHMRLSAYEDLDNRLNHEPENVKIYLRYTRADGSHFYDDHPTEAK